MNLVQQQVMYDQYGVPMTFTIEVYHNLKY